MAFLSGHSIKTDDNPNGDIEIKFTGLRPGEKLYEELLVGTNCEGTVHPRIMRAKEEFVGNKELNEILAGIKAGNVPQNEYFDRLMYPLMQLKSQGSLFRYPSVTQISQILIDLLENIKEIDQNALDIVAAYAKSLQAMLTLQIKEVENKVSQELCKALSDACNRYFKLMNKASTA